MASGTDYSKTQLVPLDFSRADSCYLTIDLDGEVHEYHIVRLTMSYAVNEIPTAEVILPVGSLLNGLQPDQPGGISFHTVAEIHRTAKRLKRLFRAKIYAKFSGQWDMRRAWPAERQVIFDGYYEGYGRTQTAEGKIAVVLFLRHWLLDLTFSSSLAASMHPGNPWQLSAQAIYLAAGSAGSDQENDQVIYGLTSSFPIFNELAANDLGHDLWGGLATTLWNIAATVTSPVNLSLAACGQEQARANSAALNALFRFESVGGGQDPTTGRTYEFGAPLELAEPLVGRLETAICRTLGMQTVQSFASATMWDKLVGEMLPPFHAALVPLADRALVIANAPMLRVAAPWRTLARREYESVEAQRRFEMPLRGVAVMSRTVDQSQDDPAQRSEIIDPLLPGGCFAPPGIRPDQGVYLYVPAPDWLVNAGESDTALGSGTNAGQSQPVPSETTSQTPAPPQTPPSAAQQAFELYAQAVYANHTLMGSSSVYSGKLRFDIAPGSIVLVQGRSQVGRGSEDDDLADDEYGYVARVTITIDSESPGAGTTFLLTHVRSAADFADPRYQIDSHPLFHKNAIHGGGRHGAPLLPAFKDLD